MSWRGVKKSISRLPHQFKMRNGGGDDVTRDQEYLALESKYKELVKCSDQLRAETMAYRDYLAGILNHQLECANNLAEVYGLVMDDTNTIPSQSRSKTADIPPATKQALEDYTTAMAYCREETCALLDELDAYVVRPADQYQTMIKTIDKTIIKRQHKLIDFDRHRVSYMKYSAIPEPSPSEEKNLFRLQAQFENAAHDYEYFNNMLKKDLVTFLDLSLEFIVPIVENLLDIQTRIIGGVYGRMYEVIQHNQLFFPTLDMSIDEGYMLRLSQVNARQQLEENIHFLKKGLKPGERPTTSTSPLRTSRASSFYSKSSYNSQYDNETHLSTPQGYSDMGRALSSNSYIYSDRERSIMTSSYKNNNTIPPSGYKVNDDTRQGLPATPPPLLPKPLLSPNVSYLATSNNSNNDASSPPSLAKKPLLSQRPSYTHYTAQNNMIKASPPSIRHSPSTAPSSVNKQDVSNVLGNANHTNTILEKQQRGKPLSVSDIKFGYQTGKELSSATSSYHTSIMTPSTDPSISVIECHAHLSPFSDPQQQEVIKKKRTPPPPPPPPPPPSRGSNKKSYVEALYDLSAQQDGDLSFSVGDRIEIVEKSDKSDDWWKGRIGNQVGMFPANYVRQI